MAMSRSPIVGVFDKKASAERAIEELYNAGIPSDRISYSGGGGNIVSEGFLDSIKHMFSGVGHEKISSDIVNDLSTMGLSREEAQYYAQEYDGGRTIVAVQIEQQSQDVMNIMRNHGAHDFRGNWNQLSQNDFPDAKSSSTGYAQAGTFAQNAMNRNQGVSQYPEQPAGDSPPIQTESRNQNPNIGDTSQMGSNTGAYNQSSNVSRDQNINTRDTSEKPGFVDTARSSGMAGRNVNDLSAPDASTSGMAGRDMNNRDPNARIDTSNQGFIDPTSTTGNYGQGERGGPQGFIDPSNPSSTVGQQEANPNAMNQQRYSDPTRPTADPNLRSDPTRRAADTEFDQDNPNKRDDMWQGNR